MTTSENRRESYASVEYSYGVRSSSSWTQLVKRMLLASLQLVLLAPRAVRFVLREQKEREAPVVRGSLLWGSALAFRDDAVGFLQRTSAALGPAFTLRLFSYWVTLLSDTRALAHVESHPQLSFDPIPKQANKNVYRFPTRNADLLLNNARRAGTGSMLNSNLHTFSRSLRGAIETVSSECMQQPASTSPGGKREISCGLYKLLERTVFVGIFEGLFGRWPEQSGFTARQMKGPLDTIRRYFNLLYIGLPHWLFPEANRAMRRLAKQPTPEQFFQKEDAAEFTKSALRAMRADGQSAEDCAGHNLVLLHVNDTTFRFGFWLMYHLLEQPEALAKVLEEVDAFVDHHSAANGEVHIPLSELRANSQMPFLGVRTCFSRLRNLVTNNELNIHLTINDNLLLLVVQSFIYQYLC